MARTVVRGSRTRGSTDRRTEASTPAIRDLGGPRRAQEVAFEARTAYDFIISAAVCADEEFDLPPEDRAWLDRSREAIGARTRELMDACVTSEGSSLFHGLAGLVVGDPGVRAAADLLSAVERAGPHGLAHHLLRDRLPLDVADARIAAALAGDVAAVGEVQPRLEDCCDLDLVGFVGALETSFEQLWTALSAWLPHFAEVEPRIGRLQRADLESRAQDRARLQPIALIERVTGGVRWFPEPQVRRIILAPSYFTRPFNHVWQGPDWRLFCYPIADAIIESTESGIAPPSMVRLFRALGDPTRMRILRLLVDRDLYLTELATELDLSKPTTKHHLALLRAAGLVTVTEEGGLTYYSLRRERLDDAGSELRRFLA